MSSTEAKYFAMCAAAREILFVRDILLDLHVTLNGPTRMATDNKSVVDLAFDPIAFMKTKHILRAAEFVRDLTLRRVLDLKWISGQSNPAALLTKPFDLARFSKLLSLLRELPEL